MEWRDRFIQPLRAFHARLTPAQRAGLGGATGAVVIVLLGVITLASRTVWVTVYPADGQAAAEVLDLLQAGRFEARATGEGIQVAEGEAAEARLRVAAMTGFGPGTTGCDEDAAPLTAPPAVLTERLLQCREAALSQLVSQLAPLEWGRVKLAVPHESPFLEEVRPPKASVVVKPRAGAVLAPSMVRAIQVQVAGAVEGLSPDLVSVTDVEMRLYTKAPADAGAAAASTLLEHRTAIESGFRAKVQEIVDARFGAGRGVVHVTVELDPSSEETRHSDVDPERMAPVVEVEQEQSDSKGGAAEEGVPGATSNLPGGQGAASAAVGALSTRTEARRNNEVSRTLRLVERPAGGTKRVTVAVLVQGTWKGEGEQRQYLPTPREELDKIASLVKAAVALDPARGDVVTVEDAPFEVPAVVPPPPASLLAGFPWEGAARWGGVALAFLFLWAGFLRPITRAVSQAAKPDGAHGAPFAGGAAVLPVPAGAADGAEERGLSFQERLKKLTEGNAGGNRDELARLLREDLGHTVSTLRAWISDDTVQRN